MQSGKAPSGLRPEPSHTHSASQSRCLYPPSLATWASMVEYRRAPGRGGVCIEWAPIKPDGFQPGFLTFPSSVELAGIRGRTSVSPIHHTQVTHIWMPNFILKPSGFQSFARFGKLITKPGEWHLGEMTKLLSLFVCPSCLECLCVAWHPHLPLTQCLLHFGIQHRQVPHSSQS